MITFNELKPKDAQDFLKRENNLTYIEYLISKKETGIDTFQQILSQYVLFINDNDHVHQFALEQFTRCVCIYALASLSLAELSKIKTDLDTHFHFYCGKSLKPTWLTAYIEKNNTADMIQQMFAGGSLRIRIGQLVPTTTVLANIDLPKIQLDILAMANDPFFNTHQQPVFGAINTVTATAGWAMRQVPGLAHINTFTNRLAQATGQPLEIRTGRKYKLEKYAERVIGLLADNLAHINQKQKLEHIELLCIFFENANETLQGEIAEKANRIILSERSNLDLLRYFIKNIAPPPLGLQCFGMRSKGDFLSKLSAEVNNILLHASMLANYDMKRRSVVVNFTEQHNEALEWTAYFACMGKFSQIREVRITCETPTRRQMQLMLYLMGSTKLVIESSDPVHIAKFSTLATFEPKCSYDITKNEQAKTATEITHHALAYGQEATRIKITDPKDETVGHIMKCTDCFAKVFPGAAVQYTLHFTQSKEYTYVEFQLSAAQIMPYGTTKESLPARDKLLGYILDFFSDDWKVKLAKTDKLNNFKARPVAMPAKALAGFNQQDFKNQIEKHRHLQLFVYNEPYEGKGYLYDIHLLPLDTNNLRAGSFALTQEAVDLAKRDFSSLNIPGSLKATLRMTHELPSKQTNPNNGQQNIRY